MLDNLILRTDSYKVSHRNAYTKGLKKVQSYLESRGGKYSHTLFFGLQYFLKRYFEGKVISKEKIDEAQVFWDTHFGRKDVFSREPWEYILSKHDGKLPIRIRAVPEGSIMPNQNVSLTIENTDENCAWLPNYLETTILNVWYPITIASQEYQTRKNILEFLKTSGSPESIDFKVHDFGYRGVTCPEQAALGAAAHLLSFLGTDTVAGIKMLQDYYGAGMCGFSCPATEHSVMCSFGRENEIEACSNWLDQYPTGLIACVSDTYDIYNCCANIWGGVLKDKVKKRDGCLVVRPDSGDYLEVVPKVLEILWEKFGGAVNGKGYKVLDPHVRVIQGDGMDPESICDLYSRIISLGWSADNLVVGSGGGLLMKVNRDTNKFAIKACAAEINGKWIDIFKDPITDPGKRSKTGRLELVKVNGEVMTIREDEMGKYLFGGQNVEFLLNTVFEDGVLLKDYTLDEVKKNMGII